MSTYIFKELATRVKYVASLLANWSSPAPVTVQEALDELSAREQMEILGSLSIAGVFFPNNL